MKSLALPITVVLTYAILIIGISIVFSYGWIILNKVLRNPDIEYINAVITILRAIKTVFYKPGTSIYVEVYSRGPILINSTDNTIVLYSCVPGLEEAIRKYNLSALISRIDGCTLPTDNKVVIHLSSPAYTYDIILKHADYTYTVIKVKGRIGLKIQSMFQRTAANAMTYNVISKGVTIVIEVLGGQVIHVY